MAEFETMMKVIEITENIQNDLKAMEAEGWVLMPGFKGIALFPVHRLKTAQQPSQSPLGIATIAIDESKIKILRDGKLIDG